MPFICSTWIDSQTPDTDPNAEPSRTGVANDVTAIEVKDATYRGCQPFSGVFEMVNPTRDPRQHQDVLRVEVYCCWHGVKPPTTFPHLNVPAGSYKILKNYSGQVIRNID
ncbi:Uncharacterised protein [Halioglobus japonicus]|nr:Uncharacterised protein [Halioglobus japonicus]